MIDRFNHPPVDAILRIEGVDLALAKRLFDVLSGAVDPCEASAKCAAWVRQCCHTPSDHEQILFACDDLLDGCGMEALSIEDEQYTDGVCCCPPFSYVNFGDAYVTTLARDHERGQWVIASWGDLLDEYEREHKLGSHAEYEKEPESCTNCHRTQFTFARDRGEHGCWVCEGCNAHHTAAEGCAPSDEDSDAD